MAYLYDYLNSIDDYPKPFNGLKKEDYFSKLKNAYPSDEKIERTKKDIELFDL